MAVEKETKLPESDIVKSVQAIEEILTANGIDEDLLKSQKEDEPAEDEPTEDDKTENDETEDDVEKSFSERLEENEDIQKAIEVSGFLSEVVNTLTDALGTFGDRIEKLEASNTANTELLKSLGSEMVKRLGSVNTSLMSGMETLQKSFTAEAEKETFGKKKSVQVLEKSFEAGAPAAPVKKTRAQIGEQLFEMLQKGEHGVTTADITSFEASGVLRKSLREILNV